MSEPAIDTLAFSHGTLECREPSLSNRFYREFLGLRCVRMSKTAQYIWLGGEWLVACLAVGDAKLPQGIENRFVLRVRSPEEVDAAFAAAVEQQAKWNIEEIRPIVQQGGERSFCLRDLDSNWWEISFRSADLYEDLFSNARAPA
jgi:catechol 2,3-dioxygenase-like lactoylglutathione lyase family enzyme